MNHYAIEQVIKMASSAKSESDFAFYTYQLVAAEALAKTIVSGMVAAIDDDKDRNRYRLEHLLVHADGLGDWERVLEGVVSGAASKFILAEAWTEQSELNKNYKEGDWQYDATVALKQALDHLKIKAEDVPKKTDLKRWFRLFVTLRNKTRAHGTIRLGAAAPAAEYIERSISLIYQNFHLFKRAWAYLHRHLSSKYRVSPIANDEGEFNYLKLPGQAYLENGVYVFFGAPRQARLVQSDPDLQDFYFPNGALEGEKFELFSYATNSREHGDAKPFLTPPGLLPSSETEGYRELLVHENCFSNAPNNIEDYVERDDLESELKELLLDDRHPVITLLGRGGIGKTSLSLRVIHDLFFEERYETIVWFSARDVDLTLDGPRTVRPEVQTIDDLSELYVELVPPKADLKKNGFSAKEFFKEQLYHSKDGPCLFVFDNFETMQNPFEMFKWIETFIRSPNKALITTRLREFRGDYPVEVSGMNESEARKLIKKTASFLGVNNLINDKYINGLIEESEGHPYIIKILLGEIAKKKVAGNIRQIIAGTEDVLTALFERTYADLSPCAQRAFLTLSAWKSPIPQVALEVVLIRSTQERSEVENGIESLLQFSIAEAHVAQADGQKFLSLPLATSIFGMSKLNVHPSKAAIEADTEILQMLGATTSSGLKVGLLKNIEKMIKGISKRIEDGEEYEKYTPILEAICRKYTPGWLLLAEWHMKDGTSEAYDQAKEAVRRFLETNSLGEDAAKAWQLLSRACYRSRDYLGVIHASVERSRVSHVPFHDLSNTANTLNKLLNESPDMLDKDQKTYWVDKLALVLRERKSEAKSSDLSRMAWLEIHRGQEALAIEYVKDGLKIDPDDYHLVKLAQRLNMTS